ncbi:MAG TPA: ATP-binding protein [Gemmatimonadaceae bacterium]
MTDVAAPSRAKPWAEAALWFAILAALTLLMVAFRDRLNAAHVTLGYLLVVQGGSARGGRPLGVALALSAFLCFDILFLPPYGTLVIQNPLNWLVLVAFLASGILSAQLLYRAQAEAEVARTRAAEVDHFAILGAETLNVARSEDALAAIALVIRTTLRLDACSVYVNDAADVSEETSKPSELVRWVASRGESAAEILDGTTRVGVSAGIAADQGSLSEGARELLQPLRVRERTVGVLSIRKDSGLSLDSAELRVLEALSYYAALGVERVRLAAEAERAQALQEANRTKDAVLASVSHDLRTPLTTIKGLAHEIAAAGDARAGAIEIEADRLNAMVANVLDLSRIASGAAVTDVAANDAEDLVGAAAQRVSSLLGQRELRIDVAEPSLVGRFDFSQTLRALVNLIENAAKYSPASTPIDLRVARLDSRLVFEVADRGAGVPAAESERIFERFYRRPGMSPDVGGAGLGLSIARGIAEAEGGSVTYATRSGGGSLFTLSVPAVDED